MISRPPPRLAPLRPPRPSQVDVDVVMSEGEARYAVVVDNGPTAEPYFAETWGCCPSRLDAATQGWGVCPHSLEWPRTECC